VDLLLPAGVFLAVFAAALAVTGRSARPVSRLARHQVVAGGAVAAAPRPRLPLIGRARTGGAGALATRVSREEVRSKSRKLLLEAGDPLPLGTYLVLRYAFLLVVAPLLAIGSLTGEGLTPRGVAQAGAALIFLPMLPQIWLKRKARKRAKRIELAMPDALDLLVVCVEGGLSLDGGIQQVARRTEGELANELRRMQAEVGAGMSRREALQALAARSQSQSLGIFCTTIVQADKMGMSIGSTLRTLVETMRTRRRQAAETQARKAPVKMLPILVFFMIPSLFIVILGPAVLSMIEFFSTNGG
jgi:tight adherence protein C